MKISALQKVIEDAQLCANIVITFQRYVTTLDKVIAAQNAGDILEHFARAGRIVVVATDKKKSTITIAKTPAFQVQDAPELARQIAEVVSEVVAREIPEHHITLEQGERGWQLRLEGGNKLLRMLFKATCEPAKKFSLNATVLSDTNGGTVLDLSQGDETVVLEFAEMVAEMFQKRLIL